MKEYRVYRLVEFIEYSYIEAESAEEAQRMLDDGTWDEYDPSLNWYGGEYGETLELSVDSYALAKESNE